MIDRIERRHSYSMNHAELPVVSCPEPDEALEFRRIRLPKLRRRVPGEAMVKFGPPGRGNLRPVLAQSAAPFDLQARGVKTMRLTSFELRVVTPECLTGELIVPSSIDAAKKHPHVGQEILLDGRRAIITWLGETKFEAAIAGCEGKARLKYSDYPDLRRGQSEINKSTSEPGNVAS